MQGGDPRSRNRAGQQVTPPSIDPQRSHAAVAKRRGSRVLPYDFVRFLNRAKALMSEGVANDSDHKSWSELVGRNRLRSSLVRPGKPLARDGGREERTGDN